jgi:DNA replication protein DnaC
MSEKIDRTLKKLAAGIPTGKADGAGSDKHSRAGLPGDPNCPICGGIGFIRMDLPVGDSEFGKLQICTCRSRQVNQQVRQRLYDLSHLNELGHLTFDNFQPRGRIGLPPQQANSLQMAYNQASQFAQNLEGWLLLQGDYGCGKTHLAAAIANFSVSIGVPSLFITVPDLLDSLRFAYQDPDATFESRFEEIRNVPLLVMDDFGTQNATPWAQEKLFQIINYRYINHLPLVVTTNLSLRDIEGRIRSRLEDPELVTIVHILATDYRRPTGDSGHPELSSLELHHSRTFAAFDPRKGEGLPADDLRSLDRAFQLAREFAESPRGWLVFTGPYGCGKTYLAAAIANYRADLGAAPLFVVVPDLLDHLRSTFSPNSTTSLDRAFENVRTAPLLILDDLGSQSMTPWVREKLFQLFNYRYNAELPTIITTADYMDQVDPRLLSRLQDSRLCTICAITAPGYRGGAKKEPRSAERRRKL